MTPRPKHIQPSGQTINKWVDREYVTTAYRIGIAPNRITSTSVVECFPPREKIKNENSLKNLENKAHGGKLSSKALSKMANAIDWLLAAAQEKEVFQKSTGTTFKFKINFITLTLPNTEKIVDDIFFKDKLVKPYLNALRKYYELNNYVWKLEFQKNGKLHLHITTDTFIHYKTLRKQWNRVLEVNGLISDYTNKMSAMSENEYLEMRSKEKKFNKDKALEAYKEGVACDWKNPNTTDVHSVQNIENLAAYLMKYMSKQDEQLSKVKGRIWGCSQALSKANALKIVVEPNIAAEYYESMNGESIEAYDVEVKNERTGRSFIIARIFKTSHDWLKNKAHPAIRKLAHETLLMIRGLISLPQIYYV